MIATLALAAALLTQNPKIEVREDPIDHKKSTNLNLGTIARTTDGELELALHFYSGVGARGPVTPDKKISLHFAGESKSWNFLHYRKIVLADGGMSIDHGNPDHRGDVGHGEVLEQFSVFIKFEDLERLAREPNLQGKAGIHTFTLSDAQQRALRKFVERLQMSEEAASKLDAADRQAEEQQQQVDADRRSALRDEWSAARKKAESDAKKGSKSVYTKNLARNLMRAEEAFRDKHQLTVPEFRALTGEK